MLSSFFILVRIVFLILLYYCSMNNLYQAYTANVKGLHQSNKSLDIFTHFFKCTHSADILFLQETHSTPDKMELWRHQLGHNNFFCAHGSNVKNGVAIIFSK